MFTRLPGVLALVMMATSARATPFVLGPVSVLFTAAPKDLMLTVSGTVDLDTSAGRPYQEIVPADVTVAVTESEL